MKTNFRKDGDSIIVTLEGRLDYETTDALRENLDRLFETENKARFIFDFAGLQFVGSSGISAFIQTLREFNSKAPIRPRYTNVRSEFKKMITAFDEQGTFDFDERTDRPLRSIDQ